MQQKPLAFQPGDTIRKFQEKKLRELVEYLHLNSPFYKDLFSLHKIDPQQIKTLSDLNGLPLTTKEDLQQRNLDFLCVPRNKVIEYSSTSGTLGSPVTIMLTDNDLN